MKFTLTLLLNCLMFTAFCQDGKLDKIVERADAYYTSMKYHKAIPLYCEAVQSKEKNTLALRTKLAYSYRMLNQMDKAEELYAEIVLDKKARAITYYYYGEALMSNGKYDEAKEWFLRYDAENPKDTRAITMVGACEKAKHLKPVFPDITLSRMPFNTDGDDYAPMYYGDGLLFVSDNIEEDKQKTEYEWTGRSFSSVYYAETDSAEEFTAEALPFSKKVNKRDKNSGPSSVSGNGELLFFSRNNDLPNKSGNKYMMAIYYAERTVGGWKTPKVLPVCNEEFNFMHPAVSFTGDTVYFISDKPGGFGETDIYVTYRKEIKKRNKKGELEIIEKWVVPTNLGEAVNTAEREAFPYITPDGILYFSSKGHPGFGGFDLFMATMNNESTFERAINLGSNINSPKDDMSIIFSSDKRTGYFASNRLSGTDDDIFAFRKGHKQIIINGETMDMATKQYLKDVKVTLKSYDDDLTVFTDEQGNFLFKAKPGKEYKLKIALRGYAPYEYPINAVGLEDGEVLPFLIKLRQLESIPYVHIDHEQSAEEEEPNLEMYEPQLEVINEEIDPYQYLPPSIPARGLVAKHVKKVVDAKQTYYRNELNAVEVPEAMPEATPAIESKTSVNTIVKDIKPSAMPEALPELMPQKVVAPKAKTEDKPVSEFQMQESTVDDVKTQMPENKILPEVKVNQMFMDLDIMNEYNKPVGSVIVYLMNAKGQLLETIFTDYGGNVELLLKPNENYMVKFERDGFITKSMMVCTEKKSVGERLNKTVFLKSNTTTKAQQFDNLYFSKGAVTLSLSSSVELDRVFYTMQNNPSMMIEIVGFTDALGDKEYKETLSKDRAMEAAKYLISKGIEPTRIIIKGKGDEELVNGCKEGIHCSDKLHQENRRVTITVVE